MLRENCKIGMKVIFGRPNGEKTIGEVVKIGPKKAKVKTLEARGYFFRKNSGVKWSVPFGLMEHLDGRLEEALLSLPPKDDDEDVKQYLVEGSETLPYTHLNYHAESLILQAIFLTYKGRRALFNYPLDNVFHPELGRKVKVEFLDGILQSRLKNLFECLGRPVSESVSNAWHSEKIEREQQDAVRAIVSEFKDGPDRVQAWSVIGSLLGGNVQISVKRLGSLLKNKNALPVRGSTSFRDGEELTGQVLSDGPDGMWVALPNGEVGHAQNDARTEEPCGEAKMVDDFLASECQAHGIEAEPTLAHRAMQDFKMWKTGITENHWTALVRSDIENYARIQRHLERTGN